jgi:hypothetical protein
MAVTYCYATFFLIWNFLVFGFGLCFICCLVMVWGMLVSLTFPLANFGKRVRFVEFFVSAMCTVTVSSLFSIACCLREEQEFAFVA